MRFTKGVLAAIAVVVLLICLLLAAMCFGGQSVRMFGGARRPLPDKAKAPHIVVDTLNLTHWLENRSGSGSGHKFGPEAIIAAIDRTAPILKLRHHDRVMYVVKDRDTQFNDEAARRTYAEAARRNGVYVYVVERYQDPPAGPTTSDDHSARGRDDFYISALAHKWRCAILTEDRMRDFDKFRANIQPFHVYEYAYWRDLPTRDFISPASAGYSRLKKAKRVGYEEYLGRELGLPRRN